MTRRTLSSLFLSIHIAAVSLAAVIAESPRFSKSAGFYPAAVDVELMTATEGAEIRYTLDGSEPTGGSTLYQGALRIESNRVIRAAAFKAGMDSSPVVTHSFFVAEKPELNDLPVLSLVTAPPHLWDPQTGIYANPLESGDEWERPVAIEFFERQGAPGFCADAGIRIHGGASRLPQKSAKKSFRLYFRSEYGPAKLDYPIIRSSAIQRFDRLILRAGFNDAWIHWLDWERELTTYVRDPLVRDVFIDMGQPASRGDFIHLFLNGAYWGLYNVSERYDDDFCDIYMGKGDWDVVKPGSDETNNAVEASTGDLAAWNQFAGWIRNRDFRIESNYRDLESRIDLDNFIDFYILNIFAQNWDWPRHNWYAARNRDNGRWIFMPWDSECTFGSSNQGYRDSMNMWQVIADQASYPFPSFLKNLKRSEAFRRDVALRFEQQFATHLHPDRLLQLLDDRLNQIRTAIPFEAERWGDARSPDVYGLSDWLDAAESMKKFIRNRGAKVSAQLQSEGFILPTAMKHGHNPEPLDFVLMQNYPNPFNAGTSLTFNLPRRMRIQLDVFNIKGEFMTGLIAGIRDAGIHVINWDGIGAEGRPATSGTYFYRLTGEDGVRTQRMILLR
ncbi:CotH kinase family protein [bacterium]|nr:CotH kinase family protein [bacterium]